ncbi:cytidine/deoxycytidylate deaminase family protein [Mycoplasma sp. CSL10137]|uniref:deoxycytidylate deaminase n=2 Tax=Mycoplasma TaxID=2093 RepID=UPI00197B1B30|nr:MULTISPECIES: cytidine/deoxycytidylate deaminase family protein [unclassified Mycoplasma]MBN4083567.1 cytidine/deoxycytidylate deaminase family protein [Mycoplasma sp. CSL10137]MBN4084502.1 cytidine/deoxycytidylate deaminase family protein [Mycoplasma sp. CSL10166]MBU4692981.1 cytidine/deoxycytidylate deaminase family protein [Mycoplasma sp. CSL7491-lung]
MNKILNWDQYFMALTKLSALRSKDPNTKVGACIINNRKRVIALGYNGMPSGNDFDFPWARDKKLEKDNKYPYVVHAEINAILNSTTQLENAILYTSLFPCSNCSKTIVQSGITEIVYLEDKYHDTDDAWISRKILKDSNIKTRKLEPLNITLEL